ncbi:MAG: aldo/keto reductase [Planctomycetes bacterium]|nr:aldo/keto reductase [Planctomycetota bacterium]
MKKRTLGRTGLSVTELSLGGLFVSRYGGEYEQGKAAILRALSHGINYVDTAPGYGDSEEVIGRALEGVTTPLIFSTKLGGRPTPFEPRNKAHLVASIETSLKLLKRDAVDMLMIHEPDRPGQYDWWTDWDNADGPVMEVLGDLKKQGLVRFLGLGGTTVYELAKFCRTGKFDVVLTAFNYSLLYREAAVDVIPAAKEQNMGIVIGSPLQQGTLAKRHDLDKAKWLSKPRRAQFDALYKLLDEVEIPLPELGLRFVLSNPDISTVLMGPRSAAEVDANVAAAQKGPLPADLLAKIDRIAAMVPFRPCEEPFSLPWWGNYRGPAIAGH